MTDGGARCWGQNSAGQLGDGTTTDRWEPVEVTGFITGVLSIDGGNEHTCALTTEGGARCWGDNDRGQLGDGTTDERLAPVEVTGLISGVQSIAVGGWHSCALTTEGGVKCWDITSKANSATVPRTTHWRRWT
ncbi:MAG: hypothetical protein IPK16_30060 [Anaerolineales bacterium]|nr:hypothetical protein [Anaerolineales bacterium]